MKLQEVRGENLTASSGVLVAQAQQASVTTIPAVEGNLARTLELTRPDAQRMRRLRTIECVIVGFKYSPDSHLVGSLLLGLFDGEGNLHQIGWTANLTCSIKRRLTHHLEELRRTRYAVNTPDAANSKCWAPQGQSGWVPVKPDLVVEVDQEHFIDGRVRRDTSVLKWQINQVATACTIDKL